MSNAVEFCIGSLSLVPHRHIRARALGSWLDSMALLSTDNLRVLHVVLCFRKSSGYPVDTDEQEWRTRETMEAKKPKGSPRDDRQKLSPRPSLSRKVDKQEAEHRRTPCSAKRAGRFYALCNATAVTSTTVLSRG